MNNKIKLIWTGSIRRQLIIGIALVHAVLMTIFVTDLVNRQKEFLNIQNKEQVNSLANTLATNSVSWVLCNDLEGLGELISTQVNYPGLIYAMAISPEGQVLAHTNKKYLGTYLKDSISLSILDYTANTTSTLFENEELIDVIKPITTNSVSIGWVRVAVSKQIITSGLKKITINGLWYALVAILIGSVFAVLLARNITKGLQHLVNVANKVTKGNENIRITLDRPDEIGQLANHMNVMINTIYDKKKVLLTLAEKLAQMGSFLYYYDTDRCQWSDELTRLLKFKPNSGKNCINRFIDLIDMPDKKLIVKQLKHCIQEKIHFSEDLKIRYESGDVDYVNLTIKPYSPDNADISYAIGIVHNITERKLTEKAIRDNEKELKELNRNKNVLFSIISHDLRNPVGNISSLATLIQKSLDKNEIENVKEYVSFLNKASNSVGTLLENLLSWSSLQNDKFPLKLEELKLTSLIENVTEILQFQAKEKEIKICTNIQDHLTLMADKKMMATVLRNLISNAIKFTPNNGKIEINASIKNNQTINIDVIDTGVGIEKHNLSRLFSISDKFKSYGTNKEQGSGLGLNICQEFVNKHNGKILVTSEYGKGSCFTIVLPLSTNVDLA